jgi:hypothetical protein
MNKRKALGGLLAASALVLAVAGTAAATVNYATPVGWYASTGGDQSNEGAFWVAYLNENFDAGLSAGDCEKLSDSDFNAVNNGDGTADLGAAYGWVIVKQASSAAVDFDNTIFKDVAADETVFADTNGNGEFDEGDSAGISHIIVCVPGEEETPPPSFEQSQAAATDTPAPPSEEPSFEQSQAADTDVPTLPNTATIGGNSGSAPADGAWLLVVALGALLSSIVVLTPARARTRR